LKSSNIKYQQRSNYFLYKGKDKTSTIKTKCLERLQEILQKDTNVKIAPTKEELDNFWKEIFEKSFNTMKKLT